MIIIIGFQFFLGSFPVSQEMLYLLKESILRVLTRWLYFHRPFTLAIYWNLLLSIHSKVFQIEEKIKWESCLKDEWKIWRNKKV